jgi:hypothetical protein
MTDARCPDCDTPFIEDGTNNFGRIILDDSVLASTSPNGFNNPNPSAYDFSEFQSLSLDPSSPSPILLYGEYAETTIDGTLFALDLLTFNTYSNYTEQATSSLAGPYVAMYVEPAAVAEPSSAPILALGLGIASAAIYILKRKKGFAAS